MKTLKPRVSFDDRNRCIPHVACQLIDRVTASAENRAPKGPPWECFREKCARRS